MLLTDLHHRQKDILSSGVVYIRSWRTWGYTPPPPKHATSIMFIKPLPPYEELIKRFTYDPESGVLTHKSGWRKGTEAGSLTSKGYLRVKVNGGEYRVSRLIWKMYYKEDPSEELQVDHINRIRTDNRIVNLRLVTSLENIHNRGTRKKETEKRKPYKTRKNKSPNSKDKVTSPRPKKKANNKDKVTSLKPKKKPDGKDKFELTRPNGDVIYYSSTLEVSNGEQLKWRFMYRLLKLDEYKGYSIRRIN